MICAVVIPAPTFRKYAAKGGIGVAKTAAATAVSALPFHIRAADKAGSRKFRTVLIGCGWWGNNILREAMASGACEITALCDVDSRQFERVWRPERPLLALC